MNENSTLKIAVIAEGEIPKLIFIVIYCLPQQ